MLVLGRHRHTLCSEVSPESRLLLAQLALGDELVEGQLRVLGLQALQPVHRLEHREQLAVGRLAVRMDGPLDFMTKADNTDKAAVTKSITFYSVIGAVVGAWVVVPPPPSGGVQAAMANAIAPTATKAARRTTRTPMLSPLVPRISLRGEQLFSSVTVIGVTVNERCSGPDSQLADRGSHAPDRS